MTLKGDTIFQGKLTGGLKNDIRDFVNFHASSRKSENLHCDGLTLSKPYKVLDEKVQASIVLSYWRVIQTKANSREICIFCVMQQAWSIQWKVLLKCRENLWQMSWMKFILKLICKVSPYPWYPRQTLPSSGSWLPPLSFKIILKDTSFHISINSRRLYLSPECLLNFLSNFYIPPSVGKNFKLKESTFLKNALIQGIFTHVPTHSRLTPKFLSSRPMQKEITYSLRQSSFENLFPLTTEKGRQNYDLLYRNTVRKNEYDLEH